MTINELPAISDEKKDEISVKDKAAFQLQTAKDVASRIQPSDNAQSVFDEILKIMIEFGLGHYQPIGEVFERLKELGSIRVEGTTVMEMWKNLPQETRDYAAARLRTINYSVAQTRTDVICTIDTPENGAKQLNHINGKTISLPAKVNLLPHQVTPENIAQVIGGLDLPEGEVTEKVKVFVSYFIEDATKRFSTSGMVSGYAGNHTKKLDNDTREKIVSGVLEALRALGILQQEVAADDPERLKKRIDMCGSQAMHYCIRWHAKQGHIAHHTISSACRQALKTSDIPVYLIDRAQTLLKSALTEYLKGIGITPQNNAHTNKPKKEKAPVPAKKKISATVDDNFDFTCDPAKDVAEGIHDENLGKEADNYDPDFEESLAGIETLSPTNAQPGSMEKIRLLAARWRAGVPLHHDRDNKSQAATNLTFRGIEEDEGEGSGDEDEDD